jgi:hypothetical protein
MATLAIIDGPLLHAIASAAIPIISEFTQQALANTVWSFATIRLIHQTLLDSLSSSALNILDEFSPQGLANSVWSLSQLS